MIDPRTPNFASTPVSPLRPRFGYAPASVTGADGPRGPAVSVVTPFLNTGEIFHQTAACLLGFDGRDPSQRVCPGQSLQNFRWIIVNDASTDPDSLRILDLYRALARRDARIRVIDHAQNHGLPAARNTGWRAANTPYIFFLDSDDLIEPTTLEKCALHLACNPEFGFVKGFSVGFEAQEYLWSRGFHERAGMLDQNLVTATAMVRASVLHAACGFDETVRRGMEDWEFWLRCAALGHWGETIPEYLDWYRRRENQHADWDNISKDDKRAGFLARIRAAHGHVFEGRFPTPARAWHMPFTHPSESANVMRGSRNPGSVAPAVANMPSNPLAKSGQRLLMIVPWLRMGGADRFNLDLARYLTRQAGWEVTVTTTLPGHPWLPEFAAITPDVFCLDHLARLPHYPRLLSHLISSRRPDVVMVSNSQLGYFLLPYLRAKHPETTFVDFNHMEEPHWQNGGHARTGTGFQDQLDLSIVVSGHLKRWMSAPPRRAEPERIEVCHINADSTTFRPDESARAAWREELKIAEQTPVILYAARLCPQKQPMVFARTMRLLAERAAAAGTDFAALIAGEGEMYHQLEASIHAHGLYPQVRMLGTIPAATMPSLMAAADIFFLPSQWEGIALSIYEAMAAGLCVVGADVGGQTELVTPETGILLKFPERDAEMEALAYADILAGLLVDRARVKALGDAARARIIEHFELDTMGARMLALFERAHQWRREYPRQIISEGFARELALQGLEMMRVQELAEELWPYRQRAIEVSRAAVESEVADAARNAEAAAALAHVEASVPWRAIQLFKGLPPYRLLARARFGPDWHLVDPKEPPAARFQRISSSRAFKIARAVGRLAGDKTKA